MAFLYDVFISYAHDDLDWSEQLKESLSKQALKYNTFFDRSSLRVGDDWESKIQASLDGARHLIVLWSDHAKASDWVQRELWSFLAKADPKSNKDRRAIFVNLKGMNQATKTFQQISRREIQAGYPSLAKVDSDVWQLVIQEIEDGLNPHKRPLSVPLVVLTLDNAALDALTPNRWAFLKEDFGIEEKDLKTRYGNTRAEWRPFASNESITTALDTVRGRINAALKDFRLDWQLPDPTFWANPLEAKSFITTEFETAELSVLIVDPIAIYQPEVYQLLMLFQDSLASNRTVIVMLPPFSISSHVLQLRTALLTRAIPYFDDYFQPAVPPKKRILAHCSWNVSDTLEVQRHILAAAGQLAAYDSAPRSPFLSQGPVR